MINISDATKEKFQSGQCRKNIYITLPSLGISFDCNDILAETLNITESIFDGDSLELVGCICSTLQVEIMGDRENSYSDTPITVEMDLDDDEERIVLFHGYIKNSENTLDIGKKKIVAYDDLFYKASDLDVASWYESLSFPITIKDLRDSLFQRIGITQMTVDLPNDDIAISKIYAPNQLNALAVIKNICQMNGVMGIINRSGLFEYRVPAESSGPIGSTWPYPSLSVFPGNDKYPNHHEEETTLLTSAGEQDPELMSYYKKITYEDYSVAEIGKVTVRDSEDDVGVSYGTGTNTYIVQGNIFIRGLSQADKQTVAQNILEKIENISYMPFNAKLLGQPWLEVGDLIRFYVVKFVGGQQSYDIKDFVIMNRTLKGCQDLEDSYEAKGTKNQRIFISDIGTSVDMIRKELNDINETLDEFDDRITALEEGGGSTFQIVSVESIPTTPDANTLYLIQGEIVII